MAAGYCMSHWLFVAQRDAQRAMRLSRHAHDASRASRHAPRATLPHAARHWSRHRWVHDIVLLPTPLRTFLHKKFKIAGCTLAGRWWSFVGKIAKADGTPISLGYVWGAPIPIRHVPACTDEYVEQARRSARVAWRRNAAWVVWVAWFGGVVTTRKPRYRLR